MKTHCYYYNYYYQTATTTTTTTTTRARVSPAATTATTTATTAATPLMKMMMMVVMVVVVMVAPVRAAHNAELCVVETPLITPYVKSHRTVPTPCLGCMYPRTTPSEGYSQVHILDIEGGAEVALQVEGEGEGGKVVVVLATPSGVAGMKFKIRRGSTSAPKNVTQYLFVVSQGVTVEVTGLPHSILHSSTSSSSTSTPTGLLDSTRQRFGVVSSYTRVANAAEVTLRLLGHGEEAAECGGDGVVVSPSPVVECAKVEALPVDGCFHRDMLGRGDRDIHIIEVTNTNRSVVVELLGGDGGGRGILRNITLVLRAAHSTAWQLVTAQLTGTVTLLVGGEDQVENTSVPGAGVGSGVEVAVRRLDLPATFDQLLLSVLTSIGPPTSYTRAHATTHLSLSVGGATDNHINFPSHLRNYDIPTVYAEEPASVIRAGLSVACSSSAMTLSLPYAVAERVGGVAMGLLDRACVGSRNGTHIVLKADFTRCKFEKKKGSHGTFVYKNLLSVELGPPLSDDEDLAGSGYGSEDEYYPPALPSLPVTCHGEPLPTPSLPPLPPMPPKPPSKLPPVQPPPPPPSRKGYSKVPSVVRGASYTLTLYTDASRTHPIASTTPGDALTPTPVALHSRLYAQAALASVLPWADTSSTANLHVVLEECWIGNATSPSRQPSVATRLLLRKSCRVQQSVSVEASYTQTHTPTFSFQILPEYAAMDVFYLHCQLGLCSSDPLPKPTLNKCIEPALYCSNPALLKAFERQPASSSLQTLTLGPLTSASTTKSALFGGSTHTTSSSQGLHHSDGTTRAAGSVVDEEKTQIVVVRGLSTEVVVGIALASFVIGVCLTATLWIIHMKTDPKRQKRTDSSSAPRNSGYDLSAHSGSSTPSSQAPMTA